MLLNKIDPCLILISQWILFLQFENIHAKTKCGFNYWFVLLAISMVRYKLYWDPKFGSQPLLFSGIVIKNLGEFCNHIHLQYKNWCFLITSYFRTSRWKNLEFVGESSKRHLEFSRDFTSKVSITDTVKKRLWGLQKFPSPLLVALNSFFTSYLALVVRRWQPPWLYAQS